MLDKEEYKAKVAEMNKIQKQIERLKRDNNLLLLENKRLIGKIANYEKESIYLNQRNETLSALENSIDQRIKTYECKNAPKCLIRELELWKDMLSMEKEVSLEKE